MVEDIEKSKVFYHDLFDLIVVKDFGENVMLTSGLVLQDKFQWEQLTNESTSVGNASEMFFEESDFDAFLCKVQEHAAKVIYSHCHGRERFDDSFKGYVNEIEYKLVSGDYLKFKPELILK